MHYEINVAQNGRHLFATAPRSCTSVRQTEELTKLFASKFPEAEGYEVTCTKWETVGTKIY
jgi:hypothetical protein